MPSSSSSGGLTADTGLLSLNKEFGCVETVSMLAGAALSWLNGRSVRPSTESLAGVKLSLCSSSLTLCISWARVLRFQLSAGSR